MGMLQQLSDRVWCAPGGVNIGVIFTDDGGAILVDTGLNDTPVRKVLRALATHERDVRAIITTHGHADHFGGNAFAVKRTGAPVYAPTWDEVVLRYPLFQALCLYAGADPPTSMRGGFMVAATSPVDHTYDAGPLTVAGVEVEIVSLAGHSGNQMGVLIDGVFFCADVVLPESVLERYRMPYLYSVRDHLTALDRAAATPHTVAMPGHGPILDHVGAAVDQNRAIVLEIANLVLDICDTPLMPEEILAQVLGRIGGAPADPAAYYLLHPTIFAFLTHLEHEGALVHSITDGRSLWARA